MLTVKIQFGGTQNENIMEARNVQWIATPVENDGRVDIDRGLLVTFEDGGQSHYHHDPEKPKGDHVWVMNRHGHTVSHYIL